MQQKEYPVTYDCAQPIDPTDPVPPPLPVCHCFDVCGCAFGPCVYISKPVDSTEISAIGFCYDATNADKKVQELGGATLVTTRPEAPSCPAITGDVAVESQQTAAGTDPAEGVKDIDLSSDRLNFAISSLSNTDDVLKNFIINVKACTATDNAGTLDVHCLISVDKTLTTDQQKTLCDKLSEVSKTATGNVHDYVCKALEPTGTTKKRQTSGSDYLYSSSQMSGSTGASSSFPTWAIAVVVVGGVLILGVVILAIILKSKKSQESF